jgi:hypothetical protein
VLALPEGFSYKITTQAGGPDSTALSPRPVTLTAPPLFESGTNLALVQNREIGGNETFRVPRWRH